MGRDLSDNLCEQHERVVGNANRVSFEEIRLQGPKDRARLHYVRVKVRVHRHPDENLAVFQGPRCLARFTAKGVLRQPKMKAVV